MKYNDFCKQVEIREEKPLIKEDMIAKRIFDEYLLQGGKDYSCEYLNNTEQLLYNYFASKGTSNEELFLNLFEKSGFNYSASIRNAIYYLLGKKEQTNNIMTNPLLWPGVNEIVKNGEEYILDTKVGKIKVYKASEIFKDSSLAFIFDKKLINHCHERSYEFFKMDTSYQAVLSYQPNFFYGGLYHTYLEKDNHTLDIASNAYYENKEDASLVLNGERIKELSYSAAKRKIETISNTIPKLKKTKKLGTLTIYYDMKKQ